MLKHNKLGSLWGKYGIILIAFVVFLSLFFLNSLTPIMVDDYYYMKNIDGEPIAGISQIVECQVNQYMGHTGRVLAHFFGQFFLMFDKSVFNIVNSLVYLLLTFLVYKHIKPYEKQMPCLYLLCCIGLWIFIPVFGQTCLWLIGSCNYLWGTVFVLAFCLPYRNWLVVNKSYGKWLVPIIALLGLLAGMYNENTSGGGLLFALIICFYMWKKYKKWAGWAIAGLIGNAAGLAFLVLAPGNSKRGAGMLSAGIGSSSMRFISQFLYAVVNYSTLWVLIIAVILGLVWLCIHKKYENMVLPGISIFCSLAINFVMTFAGSYPQRALLGAAIFLLIAFGQIFAKFDCGVKEKKLLLNSAVCLLAIYSSLLYGMAVGDIMASRVVWQDRIELMTQARDLPKGERKVECPEIRPLTQYNPQYGLEDIYVSPDAWTNKNYSNAYGIDSLIMNGNAYRTWGQALILILKGEYRNF